MNTFSYFKHGFSFIICISALTIPLATSTSNPAAVLLGRSTLVVTRKALRFTAVIRPPDIVCREGFNKCCCAFLPDSYTFTPRSGRPSNVHHRFDDRVCSILPLGILSIAPVIFTERSKVWNLALILDTARLWTALFSKRSNILLPKFRLWCIDVGTLFSPNLVQFGWPPLKSRLWKFAPWKHLLNRQ